MKLNLLLDNPGDVRNGYVNIDALAPEQDEAGRVCPAGYGELDSIVDDAEATEIVAHEILDWFPGEQGSAILEHWLKKLAHGGRLTLSSLDLTEVARGIGEHRLALDDANNLIYGHQEKTWQFRKSAYSMTRIVEVLQNLGYRVLSKRIQNYRAIVTCERP